MPRILADLPEEDIKRLDRIAQEQGKSRAAVLREAVSAYRAQPSQDDKSWIDRGFGLWKDRTDIGDAVEWQRRERASWTRPWDDDYEDTKAEFTDLFDAEDDRQRQIYLGMIDGRYPTPKSK
jgi:predicted transcriptional regulator